VLAKIAAMPARYRAMGERLHALVLRSAPALQPKLFYGMPGYAKDGPIFRADKYVTFGSPTRRTSPVRRARRTSSLKCAWYFAALDDATEAKLSAIVRQAAT
jgi:hypothetical protein